MDTYFHIPFSMWLFDNLFLDQNTAVTINDGIDHSQDIVTTPVVSSATTHDTQWWSSGSSWDDGTSDPIAWKKDDWFGTLFQSEAEKILAWEEKKKQEPIKDIALEIWLAPQDAIWDVSFDIGWDLTFDIGWDIVGTPVAVGTIIPETSTVPDSIVSPPIEGVSDTIPRTTEIVPAIEIVSVDPIVLDSEIPSSDGSADNILFSLLNEETPAVVPTEAVDAEVVPPVEVSISTPDIPVMTDSLFPSLTDDISIAVALPPSPPPSYQPQTPDITDDSSLQNSSHRESMPHILSTSMTSKLQSTLERFIDELESLEIEDEKWKIERASQIAVYESRIAEIRTESDTRIRALEFEISDLEKQTHSMSDEKERIKWAITSFKKELNVWVI